jgi:hypothetical protein
MKRKIITLCGSTRYPKAFHEWNSQLTLQGHVVLSVGVFIHSGVPITETQKQLLDTVHLAKIDLSDEIFVLDVGGHIGSSTQNEINYAKSQGKIVRFLSQEQPEWSEQDCQYC